MNRCRSKIRGGGLRAIRIDKVGDPFFFSISFDNGMVKECSVAISMDAQFFLALWR